jgi:hypothetical protein
MNENFAETLEFQVGWNSATASILEIWQEVTRLHKDPQEVFKNFDAFMTMCELRMNGATWEEIATVAEINDKFELADDIRGQLEGK